jgi:hypothetical protein
MINAAATFLLSLALLQPMHLLPWVSWHSEVLAFLALLLFASELCFQIFANRQRYLHVPRSMVAGAFLILVLVAQYSAGVITYFGDALVLFFYVSLCVIAVTVGAHKNSLTCFSANAGTGRVERFNMDRGSHFQPSPWCQPGAA